MKYELWTLAGIGIGYPNNPWAEVYPTHAAALARVVDIYSELVEPPAGTDLVDEKRVRQLFDRYVYFSIEPAIIDTDELDEP